MTHAQDVSTTNDSSRGKKILLLLVALAVALGLVATGGSFAYAKQFDGKALPGTQVLGQDVSGKTQEEIEALLAKQSTDVTVTVKTGENEVKVPLEDLGGSIDAKATAKRALERNGGVPHVVSAAVSGEHTVEPAVQVDTDVAKAYAHALIPAEETSAVDAQVVQDESTNEFSVVESKPGKGINAEEFAASIQKSAPALKDFTVTQEFTDVEPTLTTAQAEDALAKVEKMTGSSITVTGPKNASFKVSSADRLHFIDVSSNEKGDAFEVSLKQSELDSYLQTMANEIEVTKKDGVTEVTPDGKKTVISEKQDGITITNKKDVFAQVSKAISEGKDLKVAFETKDQPAKVTEKKVEADEKADEAKKADDAKDAEEKKAEDRKKEEEAKKKEEEEKKVAEAANLPSYAPAEARNGEKWIDVNLANKTLTAYVGDQVVFGPRSIVDGKAGNETVTGEYRIYLRNEFQDLTNAAYYPEDHPKYYYTPDVPYVQYFYRGFAIHGAPWRSSFGYSGSHGCVNMSVADAKWMWDWADMGTKVVSHR